jgi:hypothetical protein
MELSIKCQLATKECVRSLSEYAEVLQLDLKAKQSFSVGHDPPQSAVLNFSAVSLTSYEF